MLLVFRNKINQPLELDFKDLVIRLNPYEVKELDLDESYLNHPAVKMNEGVLVVEIKHRPVVESQVEIREEAVQETEEVVELKSDEGDESKPRRGRKRK